MVEQIERSQTLKRGPPAGLRTAPTARRPPRRDARGLTARVQALARVPRDPLRHAPGVDEDDGRAVAPYQIGETVVDLAPHLVRHHGRERARRQHGRALPARPLSRAAERRPVGAPGPGFLGRDAVALDYGGS
jgi:hypothetical protein